MISLQLLVPCKLSFLQLKAVCLKKKKKRQSISHLRQSEMFSGNDQSFPYLYTFSTLCGKSCEEYSISLRRDLRRPGAYDPIKVFLKLLC